MFSLSRSTPRAAVFNIAVDGAEELIARHYSVVYNLTYRTMGRREDAEDIAQQTFARALPRLAELRDPEAVGGWLCRIAANLCLDELRRRQQAQEDVELDLDGLPDADPNAAPATVAERREVRAAVWSAALSLPHQQRLALALREWQGLSYKQIAEALEISVPAVETILFRARQGFRRAYQAGAEPWPANETCKGIVERLSASIDEELRAGERARIDAHLPQCETCQFAARELRATKRLYGFMPLAGAPAGAQVAALMAAPAVSVAPVVVAGFSGASSGGVLVSLGAAKVGFGSAAAMVGSAVILLMGSDGNSAFGSVEAALAAAPPVARTAVAVPPATTQPVAEVAIVAGRSIDVEESVPRDPPEPLAEVAKVEPLWIAPDVTPSQVPAVVPDAAERRAVSPVSEARGGVPITPISWQTSGLSGQTPGASGGRSQDARTAAAPARVISTGPPADVGPRAQSPVSEDPPGDEDATAPPGGPDEEKPHKSPHTDNSDHPDGGNRHATAGSDDDAPPGNAGGNGNGNAGGNGNGNAGGGVSVGQSANAATPAPQGNGVTPPGLTVSQNPPGQAARQSQASSSPNPAAKNPAPAPETRIASPPAAHPLASPAGSAERAPAQIRPAAAHAAPAAGKTGPAAGMTGPAASAPAQSAGPGTAHAPGGAAKSAGAGASPGQGAGGFQPPTRAGK